MKIESGIMSMVGSFRRSLWVWGLSSLCAAFAGAQAPADSSIPSWEGAREARMIAFSGLHGGAMQADPARLGQVFDAAPRRHALAIEAQAEGRAFSRHRVRVMQDFTFPKKEPHRGLVVRIPPSPPAVYRRLFHMLQSKPEVTDQYDELISKYSDRYHLDPRLVKSIIAAESEFDANALSPAGARGLMQLMSRTAAEMGVGSGELRDPESNIKAGAAYIQVLFRSAFKAFNIQGANFYNAPDWLIQRVIAAYHAGPRFLSGKWWYSQTKSYVRKVMLFYKSKIADLRRPRRIKSYLPGFVNVPMPYFTR